MTEATAPWRAVSPTSEPLIVGGAPAEAGAGLDAPDEGLPAVVAVLVVQHPDAELVPVMESLEAQDYSNLAVLIIDSSDRTDVVSTAAEILPDAYVHRTSPTPGFAAAANQARELVSGAAFLLFCQDDVALEARCVTILVEEMFRSNAGIVAPKLVQWDDPRRLLRIGMGSDRFGVQTDLVEPGEFDQEQYDAVGDVFVAPAGVQLIRSDLFEALEGYDAAMGGFGEDLDLCWRAHVVGARVVAVPAASARRMDLERRTTTRSEERRQLSRNRLRTLLVVSSARTMLLLVPIAVLLLVLEGVLALLTGRRQRASAAFGAIWYNVMHLGQIRRRRKSLKKVRTIPDAEVHALQARGSARLSGVFRGAASPSEGRLAGLLGAARRTWAGQNAWISRDVVVVFAAVALFLVFGSRSLFFDETVRVGQMPRLPGWRALLDEWWGGYRSSGLGGPANPPTSFLVFGLGRLLFFWSPRVLDTLLVLGPLFVGVFGAWRMLRPMKDGRAAAVAMAAYALTPLTASAFAAARWDALVVYAAVPFLVLSALRLARVDSFGSVRRSDPALLTRYGFLTGVFATFTPVVVVPAVLITVGVGLGGIAIDRSWVGLRRVAISALGGVAAVVGAAALHAPFTYDIVSDFRWSWLMGPASPEAAVDSFSEMLLFAPGRFDASVLSFGLIVAAAFPLLVARGKRFNAAVRAWSVAATSFAVVWLSLNGWIDADLPAWEILLTPAAAGLALAVGIGVSAIQFDLPGYGYGWRQLGAVFAGAGLLCVAFVGLTRSVDGRWDHPSIGFGQITSFLTEDSPTESRVLWLGDPRVLPADALVSEGGISYAVTDGGLPDVRDRSQPVAYGINHTIGDYLDVVAGDETLRLGRLLAPLGIEYVITVPQLAPAPYTGPTFDIGPGMEDGLVNQLDLQRVILTPDLLVFRNTATRGPAVALDPASDPEASTVAELLDVDLTSGASVRLEPEGPARFNSPGSSGSGSELISVAVPADGWEPGGGAEGLRSGLGGVTIVEVEGQQAFDIAYPTPLNRRLALLGQLAVLLVGIAIAQSRVRTPKAALRR